MWHAIRCPAIWLGDFRRSFRHLDLRTRRHLRHCLLRRDWHDRCFSLISSATSNPQATRGSVPDCLGEPSPKALATPKRQAGTERMQRPYDLPPRSRPRERFPPSPEPFRQHVRSPVYGTLPPPPPSPRRRLSFFEGGGRKSEGDKTSRLSDWLHFPPYSRSILHHAIIVNTAPNASSTAHDSSTAPTSGLGEVRSCE